jgi:hypothetical protein
MLDDALWDALRLEPAMLERRGAFFLKYRESLTQSLDPSVDDLIRRVEVGDVPAERLSWLEEVERETQDLDRFTSQKRRDLDGFEHAIEADALREAALATLTINVRDGMNLLGQSGSAYGRADIPYGVFLLALADPNSRASTEAALTLVHAWPEVLGGERTLRLDRPERERPEDRLPPRLDAVATAARDPAQQLYLALAARQDPHLDREFRRLFDRFAEQPEAQSSVAIGSTGLPLSDWWRLVLELTSLADANQHTRDNLRARLRYFAIEHGRQLERAQRTAQWYGGRAPVDIVDLDIAGVTCIVVRRMRFAGVAPLSEEDFAGVEDLAMVSLSVGLEIAREDEDPEDDSSRI